MLPLTRGSTGLDLNYLYFRQQVSQFNADNAACDNSREAHQQMADGYSSLIAEARQPVREFPHEVASLRSRGGRFGSGR